MLSSLLGTDGSPILQYLVVFAIMVVLLSLFALGARRFARGRGALVGSASRGRQPRLGIVDIYELDRQRQLILLRRDNVEHLLMVGGPNDLVVERDIRRVARPVEEIAPDAAEPEAFAAPRPEPSFAPLPEPAAPTPQEPEADKPRPTFPGVRSRRIDPPSLGAASTVPPMDAPRAGPRALQPEIDPPQDERPQQERPQEERPAVVEPEARPVPPVLVRPAARTAAAPAASSDIARDLERALSRPGSSVAPSRPLSPLPPAPQPAVAAAPVEVPLPPPPASAIASPEAAPDPAPEAPPPPPPAVEAAPEVPAPAPVERPTPTAPPLPTPPLPTPPLPAPPLPAPAAAASPPAKEPVKGAPPRPTTSPFSVEEIEAEFARLLGRPLDRKE